MTHLIRVFKSSEMLSLQSLRGIIDAYVRSDRFPIITALDDWLALPSDYLLTAATCAIILINEVINEVINGNQGQLTGEKWWWLRRSMEQFEGR